MVPMVPIGQRHPAASGGKTGAEKVGRFSKNIGQKVSRFSRNIVRKVSRFSKKVGRFSRKKWAGSTIGRAKAPISYFKAIV